MVSHMAPLYSQLFSKWLYHFLFSPEVHEGPDSSIFFLSSSIVSLIQGVVSFFVIDYVKIIGNSHAIVRNNTKKSHEFST